MMLLKHVSRFRALVVLASLLSSCGGDGGGGGSAVTGGGQNAASTTIPTPIYGVTLDDVSNVQAINDSLAHLPYKATVRIVLDPNVSTSTYAAAMASIRPNAYIMAEILDASYFPGTWTVSSYSSRTMSLVQALNKYVDIWEIANEINGEWLRSHPSGTGAQVTSEETTIGQMVDAAYTIVKSNGGKTAVTLWYNDDGTGNCYVNSQDSWRTWPTTFLSSATRNGTDYALFSYYPYDGCTNLAPVWSSDFAVLGNQFPTAQLGIGETGTASVTAPASVQKSLLTAFYNLGRSVGNARYIGGVFWWYYAEEMIPYTSSSYWSLLQSTWLALPAPQLASRVSRFAVRR